MGRLLSAPQIIKRSFEFWATSTKQLLNAGRGHQAPREAAYSLQKEACQNIKDKKIGCPKKCQTHRHPKTHYWIFHYTSERTDPAPPTRTQTQAPTTRKPWQVTSPTPPTGSRLHNEEEPWNSSLQRGYPKHSNLNKMKKQRNSQQIKEHDKCSPNQTQEGGIGSLPEKEYRIMITKMIQNLENKMELQINRQTQGLRRCKECLRRT